MIFFFTNYNFKYCTFFFRNFLQLPKEEINKLEWKIEKRKRKSKIKKIKINKINHLIYYVFCYFVCFYFL